MSRERSALRIHSIAKELLYKFSKLFLMGLLLDLFGLFAFCLSLWLRLLVVASCVQDMQVRV